MVHGRYTVVRKLAEGGMAEIFLARQHGSEGFEKPVVLKRIHTGFLADEQFRNMLVDEAHISMGLHHNNIVQVLDLGRAGGAMFLVLELVDGWDLAWVLDRAQTARRPLPTGLGMYVIADVCRALAYAHGRTSADGQPAGIVHRDVSPQNVLLSEQGEVKLADFGIAKAMTKRDRTATGVVKGKIAFMSPEQALGQQLDARSDLFSLGTMLYLVTTGVRPFEAATDFEVLARVQKGAFVPPEDVKRDLAPSLAAVIRRAMAADREHRYQTAEELLVDLEGIWRAEFGSPGQTELKLWLADLARADGVAPIGKSRFTARSRTAVGETADSGNLGEGDRLELGDERGERQRASVGRARGLGSVDEPDLEVERPSLSDLDTLGALEETGPGHPVGPRPGSGDATLVAARAAARAARRPRVTGNEPTTMSDLALSVGDESMEMLERLHTRSRRRLVGTGFLVVVLLGGAGAAAMWKLGARQDQAAAEAESVPAASPGPVPGAPPVVVRPTPAGPAGAAGGPAATRSSASPSAAAAPGGSPGGRSAGSPAGSAAAPPAAAAVRPAAVAPARPDAGRAGSSGVDSEQVRRWKERAKRWGTPPGAGPPPPEDLPPSPSGWKALPTVPPAEPAPAPAEEPVAPAPQEPAAPTAPAAPAPAPPTEPAPIQPQEPAAEPPAAPAQEPTPAPAPPP